MKQTKPGAIITLTHLARKVSFGALIRGVGEHRGGVAIFN